MQEQRMTVREVYENLLRELNKVNAPSLHLEDYNYFINRGITEYVNRRYNLYDTSQQTTDDLQVLTDSAFIEVETGTIGGSIGKGAYSDADGTASLASPTLTLNTVADTLKNPVYAISQSNSTFTFDTVLGIPDVPQVTLLFVFSGSSTTFTLTHTDRAVAGIGDMVLLGNADSILFQDGLSYAGKSFKNEDGILIEIPFSGQGQKEIYKPKISSQDGFPQVTFKLPENYYHMLNCIVNFETLENFKCYPKGTSQPFTARRLTADMYAAIINNAFMKPDYRRPYYYIQNQEGKITPELDIRAGDYEARFAMRSISIDYLKQPQEVVLTTLQRDGLADTSQKMEFPNYVNNEIIKITTSLVMENSSDPRLQTHIPVNQSIPNQPPGMAQQK